MAERAPSYASQLADVLRSRDPEKLRAFLLDSARRFGDDRQVAEVQEKGPEEMEELLHRMIVARRDLPNLHRESAAWLARRGVAADSGD